LSFSEDIICALATPHGRSAIAVIRISGKHCIQKIQDIFIFNLNDKNTDKSQIIETLYTNARKVNLGKIIDLSDIIDEVLIIPFLSGSSYTKEESIEIYCHGNPIIVKKILALLYKTGIRKANPGEFTKRAFLNGNLDLSQAEAVNEIISARSEKELQLAQQFKQGSFRDEILIIKSKLLNVIADLSAELDFIEEDINFNEIHAKISIIQSVIQDIEYLLKRANQSEIFKTGLSLAIIGAPNVGKSSLLNYLWGKDKAIVSNIPGTTRDLIETTIEINGVLLTLIDTAGIRKIIQDEIEKIGIQKSLEKIHEADIILWMIDVSSPPDKALHPFFTKEFSSLKNTKDKIIVVVNKIDLIENNSKNEFSQQWQDFIKQKKTQKNEFNLIYVSLTTKQNIKSIEETIEERINMLMPHDEGLSMGIWQKDILNKILKELQLGCNNLQEKEPIEIILSSLQNAIEDFSLLTGEITNEDILGRIFSKFCIGK